MTIFFISILVTAAVCFIPVIGNREMENYHAYGFPFDAIHVHEKAGGISIASLGPYVNLALFYFLIWFIYKRVMKSKKAEV
ncbi:hypothetical protein AAV98_00045 [Bacillus sp. CHD6a]|nr:hypothetical protein AAV98_00045 [Bacillus sp. CHD6a]